MKRSDRTAGTANIDSERQAQVTEKNNGHSSVAESSPADFAAILASLQTMRDGNFSVRLPGSWTGLAGKIAFGGHQCPRTIEVTVVAPEGGECEKKGG